MVPTSFVGIGIGSMEELSMTGSVRMVSGMSIPAGTSLSKFNMM